VTGYEVERSASQGSGYVNIATVNAGVFNYVDETAADGATYYYRVKATSETGDSDAETVSAARP